MTPDEVLRLIEEHAKKPAKKKRSQSPKAPKHDVVDPVSGAYNVTPDPSVWQAVHCYMRQGEEPHHVDRACSFERKERGPSVLIFAHYHQFGELCVEKCKEKVTKS